jgi:hypothetical protein
VDAAFEAVYYLSQVDVGYGWALIAGGLYGFGFLHGNRRR